MSIHRLWICVGLIIHQHYSIDNLISSVQHVKIQALNMYFLNLDDYWKLLDHSKTSYDSVPPKISSCLQEARFYSTSWKRMKHLLPGCCYSQFCRIHVAPCEIGLTQVTVFHCSFCRHHRNMLTLLLIVLYTLLQARIRKTNFSVVNVISRINNPSLWRMCADRCLDLATATLQPWPGNPCVDPKSGVEQGKWRQPSALQEFFPIRGWEMTGSKMTESKMHLDSLLGSTSILCNVDRV